MSGNGKDVLREHMPMLRGLERRGLIRGGISLASLSLLTGCDVGDGTAIGKVLRSMSWLNDRAQAALFDPNRLAPEYDASQVLKPPRFNAYFDLKDLQPVDPAVWKLEVAGKVADKTPWDLARLATLAQREMIIRHVCVEGWDYIGQWSGVPLRTFLERVGADLRAPFVAFRTADDYPSSIDMATALHPQTLLATGYAGAPLADPFGFPLRLRMATKLGYKNPKWITAIEVTDKYPGGYWEKLGFNWFAGI